MQDKKAQILEAAVDVFGKIGFSKAKIQDIASAANIGKGTVYSYFESKQEILFCACESIVGRCIQEQLAFTEYIELDCCQLIEKAIPYFILDFIPKQTVDCFLFYELLVLAAYEPQFSDRIKALLKNRSQLMEDFFMEVYQVGLSRGDFKEVEHPRELFLSFLSMIDGMIFQFGFRADSINLESLIKSELARFRKILFR